jgi:hypothetical protein
MRPSDRGFEADDRPTLQVDPRLVDNFQFLRTNSRTKIALQGVALANVVVHLLLKEAERAWTQCLGAIERDIRFAQERFRVGAIGGCQRDADPGANHMLTRTRVIVAFWVTNAVPANVRLRGYRLLKDNKPAVR